MVRSGCSKPSEQGGLPSSTRRRLPRTRLPREAAVDEIWPTGGTSSAAYAREKAYIERLLDIFERDVETMPCGPASAGVRLPPARRHAAASVVRRAVGPGSSRASGADCPCFPTQGSDAADHSCRRCGVGDRAGCESDFRGAVNLCADGVLGAGDDRGTVQGTVAGVAACADQSDVACCVAGAPVPADPLLFDALMRLPTMSNATAKAALGWSPQTTAGDALDDFLSGLRSGEGHPTPPLDPDVSGVLRQREFSSGVGARE